MNRPRTCPAAPVPLNGWLIRPIVLGLVLGLGAPAWALDWTIQTVDSLGRTRSDYDRPTSLVLDASGYPHISYSYCPTGGTYVDLKYATYDGSSWQTETVDGPSRGDSLGPAIVMSSLALDATGYPHISYSYGPYDRFTTLKYAAYDGTSWQIETVDIQDDVSRPGGGEYTVGRWNSLALDGSDRPRISYSNDSWTTNGDLKYAAYDGSSWQIETVEFTADMHETGIHTSLALDGSGRPHIGYTDGDSLRYAAYDGSSWQIEAVDSTSFHNLTFTSLALDGNGRPHISYRDRTDSSNSDLKYAVFDGSSWQIETVDSEGTTNHYTSLALDASGRPHISYHESTNYDLKYAAYDGSSWQIETVDAEGDVGSCVSLALDGNGRPHISYRDRTSGVLKYAVGVPEPSTLALLSMGAIGLLLYGWRRRKS